MTKMKFILSVAFVLTAMPVLFAQSNIGVDSYYLGDYVRAEDFFEKNITENPEEYNYYLGEITFAKGDMIKAASYYNEGLRANAESTLNKIGLAKIKLKDNPKEAESVFNDVIKKNKKEITAVLAVGRAYLSNGMMQQATQQVDVAKKMNDKNPDVYILEGDIIAAGSTTEKVGSAAGKYEMATYFSPDYCLGYMKFAKIYEYVSPIMAIEKLKTVIEKRPDYILAYGFLGKLYTQNGFYEEAINMYQTYFKSGIYTVEDIEKYARAYFFTDNFTEAEKLVDEGLGKDPNHFVLNRYKMYIADKMQKTEPGIHAADKFFALRDTSGYIANDYSVYASILNRDKTYDKAYAQYDKAIGVEPDNLELYADAASMARENKHYAVAALYVKKQMDEKAKLSGRPDYMDDVVDINTLGYDYYSAGVSISKNEELVEGLMKSSHVIDKLLTSNQNVKTDSLTDANYFAKIYSLYYLNKADSVFDILISRTPDSYSGYRYKALTKHAINPEIEDGLAKPYYEKTIDVITKDKQEFSVSDRKALLEAYNYLGYYYYMKNNTANTILYWEKVLELDPDNKNAKLVLEDIKNK